MISFLFFLLNIVVSPTKYQIQNQMNGFLMLVSENLRFVLNAQTNTEYRAHMENERIILLLQMNEREYSIIP